MTKKIGKKCGFVMPRNTPNTYVLVMHWGKYQVFTFSPAVVELLNKKLDASALRHDKSQQHARKRIKPILDAAIFELSRSVASLLRFAGCIFDQICTYEKIGVLHCHDAKKTGDSACSHRHATSTCWAFGLSLDRLENGQTG